MLSRSEQGTSEIQSRGDAGNEIYGTMRSSGNMRACTQEVRAAEGWGIRKHSRGVPSFSIVAYNIRRQAVLGSKVETFV